MDEQFNAFQYNPKYPSVADLKKKAKSRIPKFAFDYLEGGCSEEVNLRRNERDYEDILMFRLSGFAIAKSRPDYRCLQR